MLLTLLLLCSASSICAIHIPISPIPRAFTLPKPNVPEPPSLIPDTPTAPNTKPNPDTPDVPDSPNSPDDGSVTTSAGLPEPTTSQMSWRAWLTQLLRTASLRLEVVMLLPGVGQGF